MNKNIFFVLLIATSYSIEAKKTKRERPASLNTIEQLIQEQNFDEAFKRFPSNLPAEPSPTYILKLATIEQTLFLDRNAPIELIAKVTELLKKLPNKNLTMLNTLIEAIEKKREMEILSSLLPRASGSEDTVSSLDNGFEIVTKQEVEEEDTDPWEVIPGDAQQGQPA